MKQHFQTATATSEIESACSHYLLQVRTTLPLDSLVVIMLDTGEDTGRVVFSWRDASSTIGPDAIGTSSAPAEPEHPSVLNIPLHGSDGPLGGVLLHTSAAGGFSQLHCRLARDLSTQLSMRLENTQLNQRLRATSQEITLLDEVTHIITSSTDLEPVFEHLAAAISKAMGLDIVWLPWIDLNGYDIHTLKSDSEPLKAANFQLETPIVYSGEVIASLKVQRAGKSFDASERGFLALVGNQMAPAVQSARYHHSVSSQSHGRHTQGHLTSVPQEGRQSSTDQRPDSTIDLAHALCTPLTAIKGYASSLLQTNIEWPPEIQREFLRTIDQTADRLAEVIRGLLLPGQTEPRHVRCRCAPTDLPDLLDRIASELHDDMPDAPIKFRCQPVASRVTIDRSLITRVIKHLIDCSLETSAQEGIIHVEVWIGDDGPLITIARDESYQKYQWTESLPLPKWNNDLRVVACRNILKAHGSTLHIETMPDHSVRFWFTLPQSDNPKQDDI